VCNGGAVVGVSYGTPELRSKLGVAFNANPWNASLKHEPKKQVCKYNIIVKKWQRKDEIETYKVSGSTHFFFCSLPELGLFGRCFPLHPSVHHIQSE
jgi:hypothetical protein